MKKLIALTIINIAFAYNVSLNRKVDLLTQAVAKLINENQKLQNQINELKQTMKINTQMITSNRHLIEKLKKNNLSAFAIVKAYRLNVREKPSLKSKILKQLKRNEIVKIHDTIIKNGKVWYKVDNGYISAFYTNLAIRRKK